MFPCLWHWALRVVSTVNRKHGRERLQGGKAGGEKRAMVVLHFLLLTGNRRKSLIYMGAHCCTETVLTTSQQGRDKCKKPQQEPITLENKPILASVPWIFQTWLFECEECRRVQWETSKVLQEASGRSDTMGHRISQPGCFYRNSQTPV